MEHVYLIKLPAWHRRSRSYQDLSTSTTSRYNSF